jgi:DNA replication initiation complex subunit (GINS family)
MNLDDLKVIRNEERRSRRLAVLARDFYSDLRDYVDSLEKSDDAQKRDELENVVRVADAIYEKRAAKIIKLAALAAKGHKEDVSLADAELEIYETVSAVFTAYRNRLLGLEEPEKNSMDLRATLKTSDFDKVTQLAEVDVDRATSEDVRAAERAKVATKTHHLSDFNFEGQENSDAFTHDARTSTLIREHENIRYFQVRVLVDIPTFVGLDGENYKLGAGEVALLPEGNARALSGRHMAIIVGDELEDAKEDQVDMSDVPKAHNSRN